MSIPTSNSSLGLRNQQTEPSIFHPYVNKSNEALSRSTEKKMKGGNSGNGNSAPSNNP